MLGNDLTRRATGSKGKAADARDKIVVENKCKHRRTWVVSHLELHQGTGNTNYVKFRQCRRCGEYTERLA